MKKFLTIPLVCAVFLLALSCKNSQKSPNAPVQYEANGRMLYRGKTVTLKDRQLFLYQADYSRDDLEFIAGCGDSESDSYHVTWKIGYELIVTQKNFKESELKKYIAKQKLQDLADYYINEVCELTRKDSFSFESYKVLPLKVDSEKWVIYFSYVNEKGWYEQVQMMPDGTIIISSNNYEGIAFEEEFPPHEPTPLELAKASEHEKIMQKVTELVAKAEITLSEKEEKFFSGNKMQSQLIEEIQKFAAEKERELPFDKKSIETVEEYVKLKNYTLKNAIPLDDRLIFLNYQIRTDTSGKKIPKSENLMPHKFGYYLLVTYNLSENKIQTFLPYINSYSPLNFHKHSYQGKQLLYCIGDNSSLGMGTTEIYISVFEPEKLSELAHENLIMSASFFSSFVEDSECYKDFELKENTLHVWGSDFDYKNLKYIKDYDKIYEF